MPLVLDGTTGVTFPAGGLGNPAGAVVGLTDTQTLTNKTLTSPSLTTPNIDSAQFATVSGTAPIYACRAWVNFNGTGTVAIRGSGNVSSVTDLGSGNYRVNFTTSMPDVNYAVTNALTSYDLSTDYRFPVFVTATATGSVTTQCNLLDLNGANTTDSTLVMLAVFR